MDPGDVWNVSLPLSGGREQSGVRPAILIQDDAYAQATPLALIIPMTSQLAALRFPGTVRIEPSTTNGLTASSIAMVFQMRALDRSRFRDKLGRISEDEIRAILLELNRLTGQ